MASENDIFQQANLRTHQFLVVEKYPPVATPAYVPQSLWQGVGIPNAGSLPTAGRANGRVCTKSTVGAIPFKNPPVGKKIYLKGVSLWVPQTAAFSTTTIYILDRLADVRFNLADAGGAVVCDASSKLAAATGRGDGGLILVESTGTQGTATTVTAGYTNELGVTSRSTQQIPSWASATQGSFATNQVFLPLQAGDRAVRAITNYTVNSGSGTGEICLSIVKVLGELQMHSATAAHERDFHIEFPIMQRVRDDACLQFHIVGQTPLNASGALVGELELVAL